MRRSRVIAVGAVLLLAVAAGAEATTDAVTEPVPQPVAVAGTDLVCPWAPVETEPADGRVSTRLSLVAAPDLAAGAAQEATTGTTMLGRVDDPDSLAVESEDRVQEQVDVPEEGRYLARGTGTRAPGLALDALTVSDRTADHGLSGVTCGPPVNDAWFVGTGSGAGRDATVHLVNPESTPATVDIDVYGSSGQVEAPGASGVVVEPRGAATVSLAEVAPGETDVALHVVVVAGRVGVGVHEAEVSGLQARGADWVPQAEEPRGRVVVPSLGQGEGERRLVLFAPGSGTTTVEVTVVGRQGPFVPTGGGPVDLDRGRVSTVDLGAALSADDAAVLVDSPVPVAAGLRWRTDDDPSDLAFSAGSPGLDRAAVVPGLRVDGGMSSRLFLTAPDGDATVRLRVIAGGEQRGEPRTVEVGAGRTVRLPAAEGVEGVFAVVVEPVAGSGPVHAAVVRRQRVEGAPAVTAGTLRPTRAVVDVPHARQDIGVVVPR